MGLRGMRVRKSPLVRVLYAEATRPFPVNAKGAGPQTKEQDGAGCQSRQWLVWLLAGCLVVLCLANQKALASACLMSSCRSERPPGCGVPFSPLFAARLLLFHTV